MGIKINSDYSRLEKIDPKKVPMFWGSTDFNLGSDMARQKIRRQKKQEVRDLFAEVKKQLKI